MSRDALTPVASDRRLEWSGVIDALRSVSVSSPLYIVGGAVRDAWLRRPTHDLDLVTAEDGQTVAKRIANKLKGKYFSLDAERGIGRALIPYEGVTYKIDVSQFRGDTLLSDLQGRDFTINGLAVPLDGDLQQIIDPLNGLADLKSKRLRQCSPTTFTDDPIRALRGIRLANTLKFLIEPETRLSLKAAIPHINETSPERIRDEFFKILESPAPHGALRTLEIIGGLRLIVPEIEPMRGVTQSAPHQHDVWEHTLKVIEALDTILTIVSPSRTDETAADGFFGMVVYRLDRYRPFLQKYLETPLPDGRSYRGVLILAALLHDCGKPATRSEKGGKIHFYGHELIGEKIARTVCKRLRLSTDEITQIAHIVRHHMLPITYDIGLKDKNLQSELRPVFRGVDEFVLSRRIIFGYWDQTRRAGFGVCLLTQADFIGVYGVTLTISRWLAYLEVVANLLEARCFHHETMVDPPPLITGHDLQNELGLTPSPLFKRILDHLREHQAIGQITTQPEALKRAKELAKQWEKAH
jgi:tRNA nucleotidyltransferase/poly(A) polymerase